MDRVEDRMGMRLEHGMKIWLGMKVELSLRPPLYLDFFFRKAHD